MMNRPDAVLLSTSSVAHLFLAKMAKSWNKFSWSPLKKYKGEQLNSFQNLEISATMNGKRNVV